MRLHPIYGEGILARNNQLTEECQIIVMQHHERWNGTGYPLGLKKDDIHLYARICSIADVYEALTSTRAYKEKLATFEALKLMRGKMINHFEEDLFGTFVSLFK